MEQTDMPKGKTEAFMKYAVQVNALSAATMERVLAGLSIKAQINVNAKEGIY